MLIQRKDHPYINQWALAGGFVGIKESTYEAAVRELKEETGLENIYLEQLYTMSQPDRDPRMRVIDVAYIALIQEQGVKAGDDAKDALWFDITTFNDEKLILQNKEKNITIEYNLTKKTCTKLDLFSWARLSPGRNIPTKSPRINSNLVISYF